METPWPDVPSAERSTRRNGRAALPVPRSRTASPPSPSGRGCSRVGGAVRECPAIIRFVVRIAAFVAIVLWTLLLAGALQSLIETGTVLRSLELDLGNPDLEAAIYNLVLYMQQVGPVGLAIAWVVGIIVILVVRSLLLAVVGAIWRATSTWAPRRPAASPPAPVSGRRPMSLPQTVGPWGRPAPATAAPPAEAPPSPTPARVAAPPPPPSATRRPAPVNRPLVERGGRSLGRDRPDGAVVLQRPRGHMDGS